MSKLRQNIPITESPLEFNAEGDLNAYVIFTQLKEDGPFIYAGWLDAADPEMALTLAVNHYGRDQACTCIWAAPRQFVAGLRENADAAQKPADDARRYQIFTQRESGDQHFSSIIVEAPSAADAILAARQQIEGAGKLHNIWAIPADEIVSTEEATLIWENIDQSYRLARGYAKDVREKWEKLRAEKDLNVYEKDDLKETF